ncbi:MAG TPA: HAMP domain-containing sensor histidine kinase [Acetobacteraceae bacterium]|jgi:signal transduction histidine kinase
MAQTQATASGHSLSGRLLRLTLAVVLTVEILVFVLDLAHERQLWLDEHLDDAEIAVLAATASPGVPSDPKAVNAVLRLAGSQWIRLAVPARAPVVLAAATPVTPTETIDLRAEDFTMRAIRAARALAYDRNAEVQVIGASPTSGGTLTFVIQRHDETVALRHFAGNFFWLSLVIAGLTGVLVYAAALILLVRPMRQIIGSIAAFRADPERTVPLDPSRVSVLNDDEMAVAGRELAAMQNELRGALWRNARLAALGTAVAKISHDLRGILAPALLGAERLQAHEDVTVQRTAAILLRTIDRATDLVHRTLDFVREGPPPLSLEPCPLDRLADEAGEAVRSAARSFAVANQVPQELHVLADRNQLFRVLVNLMRNAAEAGARNLRVEALHTGRTICIDLTDDGPGLPNQVQAALFRPFAGSAHRGGTGLGMAIARDLMLAHGGDIELASTGPEGTVFRLTLPAPGTAPEPDHAPPGSVQSIAPAEGADV